MQLLERGGHDGIQPLRHDTAASPWRGVVVVVIVSVDLRQQVHLQQCRLCWHPKTGTVFGVCFGVWCFVCVVCLVCLVCLVSTRAFTVCMSTCCELMHTQCLVSSH